MTRILGFTVALVLASSVPAFCADAKVDKGKELFTAQKCTLCHSVAGKGNPKGKLDGVGAKLSAAEIKQWITDPVTMAAKTKAERKPPMKPKPLPADDVDALVAYLSTLKEK
jgi:mono/diheme cytochrome c family protein